MTKDASSSSPLLIEPPQSSTLLETIPPVANDTPDPSQQDMDSEPPQGTTSLKDLLPDFPKKAVDVDA